MAEVRTYCAGLMSLCTIPRLWRYSTAMTVSATYNRAMSSGKRFKTSSWNSQLGPTSTEGAMRMHIQTVADRHIAQRNIITFDIIHHKGKVLVRLKWTGHRGNEGVFSKGENVALQKQLLDMYRYFLKPPIYQLHGKRLTCLFVPHKLHRPGQNIGMESKWLFYNTKSSFHLLCYFDLTVGFIRRVRLNAEKESYVPKVAGGKMLDFFKIPLLWFSDRRTGGWVDLKSDTWKIRNMSWNKGINNMQ